MANKFLEFLKQYGPNKGSNGFSTFDMPGASGSWEETKKKKKIPSVESFLETPEQTAAKAAQQGTAQVEQNKATAKSADVVAQQLVASKAGETSKIDPVSDRYQDFYNKSTAALAKFNNDAFGGKNGTPSLNGGSAALAAYNSPVRGALMMKQRQAFRLLQGGSFADTANLKAEERQKNAALAKEAMAGASYRKNLGTATIANANTNTAAEARKAHESGVAEAYLGMQKKKKGVKIDLNDIYAMFPQ